MKLIFSFNKPWNKRLTNIVLTGIWANNSVKVTDRVEVTWDRVWDDVTSYVAVRTNDTIEYL